MNDHQLNKFNWPLIKRVFAMTKPYWVSSGKNQKWFLAGYLVLMLSRAWGLYAAFNIAFGEAVTDLWPGFVANHLPAAAIAAHKWLGVVIFTLSSLAIPAAYLFLTRKWMDQGWRLLGILTTLLLSVNGLNVLLTYLNRNMFNALQVKNGPLIWQSLWILCSVFILGIPIVIYYRYVRDRLGIAWRDWFTRDILDRYLANRKYYAISQNQAVENPDQRVSEDVKLFTQGALSFLLIVLDSVITVLSFTTVLWSISHSLSYAVVGYATFGTVITIFFGKRLIGLNYKQEAFEANFRYQAVSVRENAEAIAFYEGEAMEAKSLKARFGEVVKNYNFVIRWQRNLGFFTQGFDYMVVALPLIVLVPLYLAPGSKITFGDIMQANSAFSQLLAALSLFVAQFQTFSGFAANVNRLSGFNDELNAKEPTPSKDRPRIAFERGDHIEVQDVRMLTPGYERLLAEHINAAVRNAENLLIVGPSGSGKSSILRVIAGLWHAGDGKVITPDHHQMLFLPQMPYLPLGSLRWQLLYPDAHSTATDEDLARVLQTVNLGGLIEKFNKEGIEQGGKNGLDAVLPWKDRLSPGERQRLAFARLLLKMPKFAILDEASSALDEPNEAHLYEILRQSGIAYVSVGHRTSLRQYHKKELKLDGKGGCVLSDIQA